MSHVGHIIGIPGLEVEQVDRDNHFTVYARLTNRPSCIHRARDDVKIKAPIYVR